MRIQPMKRNGEKGCAKRSCRAMCAPYHHMFKGPQCDGVPNCAESIFPLVKRSKVGRFYFPVSVS